MIHRSAARALAGIVGTAALGASLAVSAGSPARAADTSTVQQIAASCQTTSSGRACVAVQVVDPGSAGQHYQEAFSLTPAAGQYMSPVSWTTLNPYFAGTTHTFSSGATNKPWATVAGPSSLESVIGFTYNTPGQTHRLYAGTGSYTGENFDGHGHAYVYLTSVYTAENNVVLARYTATFQVRGTGGHIYIPRYLRVFTRQNTTLYSAGLCGTGGCRPASEYGKVVNLSYRYDSISKPVGFAALVDIDGTPRTLVTSTPA